MNLFPAMSMALGHSSYDTLQDEIKILVMWHVLSSRLAGLERIICDQRKLLGP